MARYQTFYGPVPGGWGPLLIEIKEKRERCDWFSPSSYFSHFFLGERNYIIDVYGTTIAL